MEKIQLSILKEEERERDRRKKKRSNIVRGKG